MNKQVKKQEPKREEFADGSKLVTYPDGSTLIVESDLSRESVLQESRPVNYHEPPPPPAGGKPRAKLQQTSGENWHHLKN